MRTPPPAGTGVVVENRTRGCSDPIRESADRETFPIRVVLSGVEPGEYKLNSYQSGIRETGVDEVLSGLKTGSAHITMTHYIEGNGERRPVSFPVIDGRVILNQVPGSGKYYPGDKALMGTAEVKVSDSKYAPVLCNGEVGAGHVVDEMVFVDCECINPDGVVKTCEHSIPMKDFTDGIESCCEAIPVENEEIHILTFAFSARFCADLCYEPVGLGLLEYWCTSGD